jgi:L-tyrosine peroxygenase
VKPAPHEVLSELPSRGRWDFGGFAYGLEPLVLPQPGTPDAVHDNPAGAVPAYAYAEICSRIQKLGERGMHAPEVERCDTPEELFWFRWITGHQVCFVAWRLMTALLDDVDHGRRTAYQALGPMSRLVDGYSAMLLYTGSCPRELYTALIRPSMRLRHRAFSGSWAPDYWPVRDLLRGRQPSAAWSTDTGELRDAVTLLQTVHDGVAAKLVTDGKSLLRTASVRRPRQHIAGMIFDTYFMTLRAAVVRPDIVIQLLRRLVAISQDIAVNGLYADDADERPPEMQSAEVVKCENSIVDIVLDVARCASGLAQAEPHSHIAPKV